jgi:hypothetical protein
MLIGAGAGLGRLGRRLVLQPWAHERVEIPAAGDIVEDLVAYTRLPRPQVARMLLRRDDSHRAEWHLMPPRLRSDDWFYLSSTTYLFANAVHDPAPLIEHLERHVVNRGPMLDFGGGAGNLATALAVRGWQVDYLERSALQKDFVAFRCDRHRLGENLRILDEWRELEPDVYMVVCAMDVLEHVEDLESLLTDRLLPTIRHGGALVESSPFIRNTSNPMHHEHRTLDTTLAATGFVLEAQYPDARVWRRKARAAGRPETRT